jgi:hypothetical protein
MFSLSSPVYIVFDARNGRLVAGIEAATEALARSRLEFIRTLVRGGVPAEVMLAPTDEPPDGLPLFLEGFFEQREQAVSATDKRGPPEDDRTLH